MSIYHIALITSFSYIYSHILIYKLTFFINKLLVTIFPEGTSAIPVDSKDSLPQDATDSGPPEAAAAAEGGGEEPVAEATEEAAPEGEAAEEPTDPSDPAEPAEEEEAPADE